MTDNEFYKHSSLVTERLHRMWLSEVFWMPYTLNHGADLSDFYRGSSNQGEMLCMQPVWANLQFPPRSIELKSAKDRGLARRKEDGALYAQSWKLHDYQVRKFSRLAQKHELGDLHIALLLYHFSSESGNLIRSRVMNGARLTTNFIDNLITERECWIFPFFEFVSKFEARPTTRDGLMTHIKTTGLPPQTEFKTHKRLGGLIHIYDPTDLTLPRSTDLGMRLEAIKDIEWRFSNDPFETLKEIQAPDFYAQRLQELNEWNPELEITLSQLGGVYYW